MNLGITGVCAQTIRNNGYGGVGREERVDAVQKRRKQSLPLGAARILPGSALLNSRQVHGVLPQVLKVLVDHLL